MNEITLKKVFVTSYMETCDACKFGFSLVNKGIFLKSCHFCSKENKMECSINLHKFEKKHYSGHYLKLVFLGSFLKVLTDFM